MILIIANHPGVPRPAQTYIYFFVSFVFLWFLHPWKHALCHSHRVPRLIASTQPTVCSFSLSIISMDSIRYEISNGLLNFFKIYSFIIQYHKYFDVCCAGCCVLCCMCVFVVASLNEDTKLMVISFVFLARTIQWPNALCAPCTMAGQQHSVRIPSALYIAFEPSRSDKAQRFRMQYMPLIVLFPQQ